MRTRIATAAVSMDTFAGSDPPPVATIGVRPTGRTTARLQCPTDRAPGSVLNCTVQRQESWHRRVASTRASEAAAPAISECRCDPFPTAVQSGEGFPESSPFPPRQGISHQGHGHENWRSRVSFSARGDPTVVTDANEALNTVTTCPFCASDQVTATSKTLSASTYWRCHACAEIWNPGRMVAVRPFRNRMY